jgi:hypothetical protein
MSDLMVTPAATGGTHQIDFSLASIPPSEYLIEITASAHGTDTKQLIAFRVTQ